MIIASIRRNHRPIGVLILTAGALILTAGCQKHQHAIWPKESPTSQQASAEAADLLQPRQIDVLPFTKPTSFDDDIVPDGIEVVIRPLDEFGDQTKAVGVFRFELYVAKKASSDARGPRVGIWEQDLTSRSAQADHWDRITRTYRFRLMWTGESPRPGKYILEVTYLPPTGPRISTLYPIEAAMPKAQMHQQQNDNKKSNNPLGLW